MAEAAFQPQPAATIGTKIKLKRQPRGHAAIDIKALPADLDQTALEVWKKLGAELAEAGQLAAIDRNIFAQYCVVFARWMSAEAQVRELGLVVASPTATPVANPYLKVADQAIRQLLELGREMGLSPAARDELRKRGT